MGNAPLYAERSSIATDGSSRVDLFEIKKRVALIMIEPRGSDADRLPLMFRFRGDAEDAEAYFHWILDDPREAVRDERLCRKTSALWQMRMSGQAVARYYDLAAYQHYVSMSVPEHFARDRLMVPRCLWRFPSQQEARRWANDMALMLETPAAEAVQ